MEEITDEVLRDFDSYVSTFEMYVDLHTMYPDSMGDLEDIAEMDHQTLRKIAASPGRWPSSWKGTGTSIRRYRS